MKPKQLYECLNHIAFKRTVPSSDGSKTYEVTAELGPDRFGSQQYYWHCTCPAFNFRNAPQRSPTDQLICKHIQNVQKGVYGRPTGPCVYTQAGTTNAPASNPNHPDYGYCVLSPEKVRRRPPTAHQLYTRRYPSGHYYRITYYLCPVCGDYCRPIPSKQKLSNA